MKVFTQDGIIIHVPNIINDDSSFYIQELEIDGLNKTETIYPGDYISYDIDAELVSLYDLFRDKLFKDIDAYYSQLNCLPQWVQKAGHQSNICISSSTFADAVSKYGNYIPDLYKHLYLVDCQFLVGAIQNLQIALDDNFVRYFKLISNIDIETSNYLSEDRIIEVLNTNAIQAAQCVESYFTKAFSILDLTCKICYELEKIDKVDFSTYPKLKSSDKQWGEKKKLTFIKDEARTKDTLFEDCDFIKKVEAMRHEVVHNGTWELRPIKYVEIKEGNIIRQFMLFPEFRDGHLASVKNRRHFFSSENTINEILPKIHEEYKKRLLNTVRFINKNYHPDSIGNNKAFYLTL